MYLRLQNISKMITFIDVSLLCCLAEGITSTSQRMLVISAEEEWLAFKSLLQDNSGKKHVQFRLGSSQVCDLAVDGHSISLHYADLKEDVTEEGISQAIDGCFKSCTDGVITFLLLIQGGHYTKRQRRMVETLQAHFGAEALKYLVVLSLEDGEVADTLEDALLELINMCEGRYCRVTSSNATDKLQALFEMADYMLAENGVTGYTDAMLTEARKRSTEDSAMMMLKRKVQEAEEKEQAYKQLVQEQEQRSAKEMAGLKKKHAEERKREAAENKQYETKRESLEEAVISHRAMSQLHVRGADGEMHFSVLNQS